jgi:hypothetical protein
LPFISLDYVIKRATQGVEMLPLKCDGSECQWLLPVILATQEAEIRRIAVQSQSRQIVLETLSQKTFTKKGWWSG